MTLLKRLRLGSRYKRRPRRGGREGGKEHRPRGYSSSCHQSPASAGLEGADPSCQALCMRGNKETELRKDIPGASRRQSTGESIFLACQRVGEGFFFKSMFSTSALPEAEEIPHFLHQHPHDPSGAAASVPAKASRRFSPPLDLLFAPTKGRSMPEDHPVFSLILCLPCKAQVKQTQQPRYQRAG